MLIAKKWNEESRIEECFYESSNVFYSACYDKLDDLKQLTIVFKNGQQYVYNDIEVQDYIMFRDSQSQGSALNKFITIKPNGKAKYSYKRLSPVDLDEYKTRLNEWLNNEITDEKEPENIESQPARDNVVLEINSKTYSIKVGDVTIQNFDTETLSKMSLLLDTLRVNYTKTFLK